MTHHLPLLLVPTDLERRRLEDLGGVPSALARIEVCGFGVVAAGARVAQLIGELRPPQLLLVGIAGCYVPERHPVGSALAFGEVAIDGIGAGSGTTFRGPSALGFPQWPGSAETGGQAIEERLPLAAPDTGGPLLLTTCAASDSPREAEERRARHPDAMAEDMEGYAVAFAARLGRVPLTVVRGISNRVGERDPKHWRIPAALAAARRLVLERLGAEEAQP